MSCEKGAKEWESNLKSSLRVLSISQIQLWRFAFHMDTGHRRVLAILTTKKAAFQGARGVNSGKSAADTVAVEVCPSTAPIL